MTDIVPNPELGKGWVQIVHTLSVHTPGAQQKVFCANATKRIKTA